MNDRSYPPTRCPCVRAWLPTSTYRRGPGAVEIGLANAQDTEVLCGLAEGEMVIVR